MSECDQDQSWVHSPATLLGYRSEEDKMHGRPRKPSKPEDEALYAAKAEKLRALQSQFLSNHHNKIYTKEAMEVSAKLLEINPESYTAWNYRKLAVDHTLSQVDSDPASVKLILDEELRVVESALRQNFKSYGAWHHRKWVISKGHASIDHELKLLDKFQKADSRNFHAWNYRRFVAALMNRSDQDELKYTTDMIDMNFGNYSAWHNRSVLLSNLLKKNGEGFLSKEKVLEEYELVHQAIFTDPDDQSGWFYHIWLLDQTVKAESPRLVSSWPAHGSDLILTWQSESRTFLLILYFNKVVQGVNSSTVSVKSEFIVNDNLVWESDTTNNSKNSQVWVTRVSIPRSALQFSVEVDVGCSPGIASSEGLPHRHASQFSFTINMQSNGADPLQGLDGERILWSDDSFETFETQPDESRLADSLEQLSIKDHDEAATSDWRVAVIDKEVSHFRELLSLMECKIGKLTLARLLMAYDTMAFLSCKKMVHSDEILKLYKDLMNLDTAHIQYYQDEHSSVLLQKITSRKESLLRHCFLYRDGTSVAAPNLICLRLNNLSVTRLGAFDRLLWVQMLDLSHNELRSIEGLNAMQSLCCLNLSNNKLSSFTALEPLRHIKSLEVLDISQNQFGEHSVDTTRYLCSSPLSHSVGTEWEKDELVTSFLTANSYWEAYFIFKGMNLKQLDVLGNAVADENFNSFVLKILPSLKWINGRKLS